MTNELRQTALRISHTAEELTAELPALLLESERVAAMLQHGAHGRRRVGQGEAFWQYRRYQPGDDASTIDWRSSARSQHYFVREREWEAVQTLLLWVDITPSMDWRSDKRFPYKLVRALIIALALARLALDAGEQVALLHEPSRRHRGRDALDQLALALLQAPPLPYPNAVQVPRHCRALIVSDFLDPAQPWQALCALWAERGCEGQILQILDPAEIDPPWHGRLLIEGCEKEPALLAPRFENWVESYRVKLRARRMELENLARAIDWDYTLHNTGQPPLPCIDRLYRVFAAPTPDGQRRSA